MAWQLFHSTVAGPKKCCYLFSRLTPTWQERHIVAATPFVFLRRQAANTALLPHMPARTHPISLAQSQSPSYPVYTESPLRNVQLQSDVRTSTRRAGCPTPHDDVSRRNNSSTLQRNIYDVLGTSEPVDLLPHLSKRAALVHRERSDTSLNGNIKRTTVEDATPKTNSTSSEQPPVQNGLRVNKSP